MTIRHLKVFICVCKHMSMTKAAEELFPKSKRFTVSKLRLPHMT